MPTLNWIGKDKVVNHAAAVPFHVLKHKYNFGGSSENKIIHGDNLLALKSLLPEYEGRVKCIYMFAGSGTTAHAVLNLNAKDGGNRKFILVEMENYAESITAERVRRVIQGYGQTVGTGGNFDFYEVGEPLMIHGNLNENIDTEKIRAYIWYTETHSPYKKSSSNNSAYLGNFNGTAIYFHYERNQRMILDATFLRSIERKADRYLIYADECSLSKDFLSRNSISFKKIPRDIKKIWSDQL